MECHKKLLRCRELQSGLCKHLHGISKPNLLLPTVHGCKRYGVVGGGRAVKLADIRRLNLLDPSAFISFLIIESLGACKESEEGWREPWAVKG